MRVACRFHGAQTGILISPDLRIQEGQSPGDPGVVDLLYECEGEIAWVFHVSRGFAKEHGLRAGVEPLPDEPLDWIHDLECCCKKCFEEAHGGYFDERFVWHQSARQ